MIETQKLTRLFGTLVAVDGISFSVAPGEVLGFLGPNGAGKSTTMKMLTGFLSPSSGTARICGHDIEADPVEAKRVIGYLPEGAPAYGEMTPAAFLAFIADIRGLSGDVRRRRMDEVVERLHLGTVLDRPIETLSKGFKRRVGLAQAILHDPKVLILDEPTDGLDPNQKHEVRGLIRDMGRDKIIIISTHILEEVHAVCSRAIIIAGGRILADDSPSALEARSPRHHAVCLKVDGADPAVVADRLSRLPEVAGVEDAGEGAWRALPAGDASLVAAIGELAAHAGWKVRELHTERGQLDDVFRAITTGEGAVT
ncbi:MAG: ATP-binding cassette domain-containing protein [Gammaproteobacteria bacterium]